MYLDRASEGVDALFRKLYYEIYTQSCGGCSSFMGLKPRLRNT